MTILSPLLGLVAGFQQDHGISEVCQSNLRDATFVATVVRGDQNELAKINKDFGASYRFKYTKVFMREPYALRLETKVDDMDIYYIINGSKQMYKVPKARINQRNDLSSSPGRRQSVFDFGLLTPSLFTSLYSAKFVRVDRATSDYVFDIHYKDPHDTTRSRIWVDPNKKFITKREWYNQVGELRAIFTYDNPKQADGVWFPTRFTARNTENRVAGVTQYESLKANVGLSDNLFTMN